MAAIPSSLLSFLFAFAGAQAPAVPPQLPPLAFPKAVIVARVECAGSPGQSYALYLPSGYTPDRLWPIVYALDARSDGPGAAKVLRLGAERYGYIVASSNNSASDTAADPNPAALGAMWDDTRARFALDPRRAYLAGFSGTVRASVRLARAVPGAIAGILGAAAGYPRDGPPSKDDAFAFFGTVGMGDFNYDEVLALEVSLERFGRPHHFELFEGRHQWPPAELAARALAWFDLQAMKTGTKAKDAAWIEAQWSESLARAKAEEAAGRLYYAHRAYRAAAADFAGLRDVAQAATKTAELGGKRALQRDAAARAERSRKESRYAAEASFYLDWGNPENPAAVGQVAASLRLREVKKRSEEARDPEERWSARRLLTGLLAQTAYYLPSLYLERKQYDRALFVLTLASEVDPKSAYPHYRSATVWVRKGNPKKALAELARAVDLGLADSGEIEKDEDLAPLRNDEGFKALVDRLRLPVPEPAIKPLQ